MLTMGVDVGVSGCIACLRDDGTYLDLEDLPIVVHGKSKLIDGTELRDIVRRMRQGQPAVAVIEKTQPTPKLGVTQAFSMGMTLGSTIDALRFSGCSIEFVLPQVWKRALGLLMPKASDTEKKAASLHRARQLFPSAPLDLAGNHNRGEALLIGYWSQRNRQQSLAVA
jgi:hypothetical protein